jgi:RsiW-degrading membrane proteinase PrsW (M82 family)
MLEKMIEFFVSGFYFPNITLTGLLWGIGLGIVFGAIWLISYWPPFFRKYWLWLVMASSAILSWLAVAFIQIPLQTLVGQLLGSFWSQEILIGWILLAGIPQILLSGLVQEGAKLIPIVFWWIRNRTDVSPTMGLIVGAIAGAGLGIFEAVWAHNTIFASGWTWQAVEAKGLVALTPFWERFSAVAFHIAVSAIAGYGLAKGWGWQFYLIAAFSHALLNYGVALLQSGLLTVVQMEIYASVIALLITGVALWLRWKESEEID